MRIANSTINLVSERRYECTQSMTMSRGTTAVKPWRDGVSEFGNLLQTVKNDKNAYETTEADNNSNPLTEESEHEKLFTNYNANGEYAVSNASPLSSKLTEIENIRMQIMERLLNIMQLLYGERTGNSKMQSFMNKLSGMVTEGQYQFMSVSTATYTRVEEEYTMFSATGCAMTDDGRQLSFNVNINMSRKFSESMSCIHMQPVTLIDPLVINVGSGVTQISDQTFTFDLDADGTQDEVKNVSKGSGFLVYDKNGDGIINDGREMFGAISGDGFSELSKYDEDGNGFIDEGDSIYEKLRIWCKDEEGKDTLMTLQEGDVGAIFLGRADTEFTSQGKDFAVNGMFRQTGIFLRESTGEAGSIHQVDLAKMA